MPFPVGDFNLVVAGIATFAATVGYACTRRLSYSSSPINQPNSFERPLFRTTTTVESEMLVDNENAVEDPSLWSQDMSKPDMELVSSLAVAQSGHADSVSAFVPASTIMPSRKQSLKRKAPHDGFDEPDKVVEVLGYPHNLANIYPNKRSRTPSSDSVQSEASSEHPTPATTLDIVPDTPASLVEDVEILMVQSEPDSIITTGTDSITVATPATEPPLSPSPALEQETDVAPVCVPSRKLSPVPSDAVEAPSPVNTVVEDKNAILPSNPTTKSTPIATPAPAAVAERDITPRPSTPKPFGSTGFAAFAKQDPFSLSRPVTPTGSPFITSSSTSNAFAAFAGSSSPFTTAALSRFPAGSSSLSPFPSSSSSIFGKGSGSFGSGHASVLGNSTTNRDIFSLAPKSKPIWGSMAGADLKSHQNDLGEAEKFLTGIFSQDKTNSDDAENKEAEAEREAREEAKRKAEERVKLEEEVRDQEKQEKKARRERKLKEREVGHAIVENTAGAVLLKDKFTPVTGEENEDVELDQKGVRLFIKRGDKPYSEGITGHIKLLSHRTTLEERILFRREPLWKVSMNIRVQPTLRATFVPEENVLRFILKENVVSEEDAEVSADMSKQEVVIYVIKPGRSCSKQDFKEFSESLLQSSQFKSDAADKKRSA